MRLAVMVAVSATLAACNVAPPPGTTAYGAGNGRTCFWANNVSGYRMGPNDTVIVNTNSRDYYELTTQPYCARRLDFENRMALRSRGGNFICSGLDAEIYVPDSLGSTYCPVYSVRKLAPAEVEAVRARR
jgi:predicted small secreted protein